MIKRNHIAVISFCIKISHLNMLAFGFVVRVVEHSTFSRLLHRLLLLLLELLIVVVIFHIVVVELAVFHC